MRNKEKQSPIHKILAKDSDSLKLLSNIKKLTVEDVIVLYAYAEAIVETVREPLIILDSDLHVKTANKAFFDDFKVNKKETYNKSIFKIGNGQWNIPKLKKLLKNILPKDSVFNDFEVTHTFNKIGTRTMVLNARRIVLEGHKTELILLAIEDITERKEFENKLRESEQHYRLIVEQVKEHIIYTMDRQGCITDWNKAAEHITGYKRREVIGKFHGFLYTPEDRENNIPIKEMQIAEKKGKSMNERWHMGKDKTYFWGSGTVTPLRRDDGNLQGFTKIMRDITTRKEQDRRKDEFLSMASHELKTPVTTIKAYAQILARQLKKDGDVKKKYYINKIENQTNKLNALIEDFLNVSKIEAGKLIFNRTEFDLGELVNKIVLDFQHMTDTHTIKKIGKSKLFVFGDEDRIGQVLINLLSNAVKYSPKGEKIIVRSRKNKDSVTVSVEDSGQGIPKSKQESIFEKYYQVTEKGEEGKKGFGLGLFITREIIKRHKGAIRVESEEGKGSTFSFTLPLAHNKG